MSFSIGIVGLPNVGKSTLFNSLTKKQIDCANYPFCTIEPNKGIVKVPDGRLNKLAELSKSAKILPTTIEFTDIAGLVRGAHKGEGLGNQFLSHIREVDAICQVVRDFKKGAVIHVDNKIDPDSDIETINMELIFADQTVLDKRLSKLTADLKGSRDNEMKHERAEKAILEKIKPFLEQGTSINKISLEAEEQAVIKHMNFLTAKPFIYVLNVDEDQVNQPIVIKTLKDEVVIPICAQLEADLAGLTDTEVKEYLKDSNIDLTGLDRIISESYKILNLITYFTSGPKETRAWTITQNTRAPQAAGKIHTDFERGFIATEVINWLDLVNAGSETVAKEQGKMRLEGKEYIVQDGDVCVFRFNV